VCDFARNAQRDGARTAGGDASKDALLAREPPCHVLRVGLRYVLEAVDALGVVDLGQIRLGPLADARDLRAFLRLAADDADRRILLLQKLARTHDRACRSHARHEMLDASFGIAPCS